MTVRMDPMIPLTPEESLYAFMDGELDTFHEQPLFDALAGDAALRGEMKDLLAIRSAVHRDTVVPPADVESRIIAGVGLPMAGAAAAGNGAVTSTAALATAASGSMSSWLSKLGIGMSGMIAGIVLTYFLMRPAPTADSWTTKADVAASVTSTQGRQPASNMSSTASTPTIPPPSAPSPTIVYIYRDRPVVSQSAAATQAPTQEERPIATSESMASSAASQAFTAPTHSIDVTRPHMQPSFASASVLSMDSETSFLHDVRLRLRSLPSGIGSGETVPASIGQALLPNQAISMSLPIGNGQRLGVEMANESFQQRFDGVLGGRSVTYQQTPTLFWLGATYAIQPFEGFLLDGMRPYAELMVGGVFQQGPIAHGSIGLTYRPLGPIAIMAGLNTSALLYRHDATWYSSTKWGMTYGLSIDLGRLP
ncbi:MAG: hypothetical protein FGM24_10260 [Candidatus Kapabacteria bacterium]|nr:hypothetical protein [Candidatus Kapabacteria bacterium]